MLFGNARRCRKLYIKSPRFFGNAMPSLEAMVSRSRRSNWTTVSPGLNFDRKTCSRIWAYRFGPLPVFEGAPAISLPAGSSVG